MKNTYLKELLQEALSADDMVMVDMITEAMKVVEEDIRE